MSIVTANSDSVPLSGIGIIVTPSLFVLMFTTYLVLLWVLFLMRKFVILDIICISLYLIVLYFQKMIGIGRRQADHFSYLYLYIKVFFIDIYFLNLLFK